MSFKMTAGAGGGTTEKPPAGNHLAVLVGIFDMGTQQHEYQGKESWRRDVYLLWELLGIKVAGAERNHVIGTAVTMSMNEKSNLRAWVQARTGKVIPDGAEFDITTELGQPCLLNVIEKGGYPKVDGVAGIPAAVARMVTAPSYKPTAISLDEFQKGAVIPEWVPFLYGSPLADHIRACREIGGAKPASKKVQQQPAGAGASTGGGTEGPMGGPIPF